MGEDDLPADPCVLQVMWVKVIYWAQQGQPKVSRQKTRKSLKVIDSLLKVIIGSYQSGAKVSKKIILKYEGNVAIQTFFDPRSFEGYLKKII